MSQAIYSHDRRDELATPLCGAHRPQEVHKNPLLVKPILGCVKATVYDLPSKANLQHEFGLRQERDGTTSNEVLGAWNSHDGTNSVQPGRDFKMLNKQAVVTGVTTCKGIANYRSTHDFRLKLGSEKPTEIKPYDQTTSFGRPSHPTTSFNDLFSHSYRYDWVADTPPASEVIAANKPKKPAMTKTATALAAAAKAKMAPKEIKKPWVMSAFKDVPPKIGHTG
jgi:hypothetical protein